AQTVQLAGQGSLRDLMIFGFPLVPVLPVIAAAPAGHDQNPITIREIEELVRLQLTFEANRIQTKVADVPKLVLDTLAIDTQKHVGRPAAAANQDFAVIDMEEFVPFRSLLRRDFANAELGRGGAGSRWGGLFRPVF